MSHKDRRAGGKYTGNHTTLIPAAAMMCDIANLLPAVTRISPGFIKAGLRSVNGQRRVKIVDIDGGILLSVRDNTSNQEVYVYASDVDAAKSAIGRGARLAHFHISFS